MIGHGKVTLNRALRASWLFAALELRAERVPAPTAVAKLQDLLAKDLSGKESIRKSLRYLRQIWLEPHPQLGALQEEALDIYRQQPTDTCRRTLNYFMLLAIYPFAREVAGICGQLQRIQGNAKTEQIKRKITSLHGVREPVVRSARYAVFIFSELGILKPSEQKGIYTKIEIEVTNPQLAAFAISALMASLGGKTEIGRTELENHPSLFAFDAHTLVAEALNENRLFLSRESISRDILHIRH